jgi:hypothetical protein
MKKEYRTVSIIITLILLIIVFGYGFDTYCLEKSKKATWIKPLEKATLTVGKFTYEYIEDATKMYKGTFRIFQNNKVLFTDKVGGASEGVTWRAEPKFLEPFQMITPNSEEPPVVFFYSLIGRADLEIRIYSTTEPKLLDVLHVGEVGTEIKDIDNDGLLEFETENCFQLPLPPKDDIGGYGYCTDAIYHFSKGKFKLAKGGEFNSMFLNSAQEHWRAFEKAYKELIEMKNRGEDWKKIREKYRYSSYKAMLGNLAGWLAQIEGTADQEKIKEALEKLRKMSFLLEKEKTGLIECLP